MKLYLIGLPLFLAGCETPPLNNLDMSNPLCLFLCSARNTSATNSDFPDTYTNTETTTTGAK